MICVYVGEMILRVEGIHVVWCIYSKFMPFKTWLMILRGLINFTLSEHQRFSGSPADRRGHPRHRLAAPLSGHTSNGQAIAAMTLEISESGLAAVLANAVRVGATGQLDLLPAGPVTAQVRHNVGRV